MRFVITLCALLWAAPALATPPRVTGSDDRLVAATQSHFYVLRDISDNLGSHYARLHDQHLVEIDTNSGKATRFWPLRRMHVNTLTSDDLLVPGEVTDRPGDTHDMIALLRGLGAAPVTPQPYAVQDLTLIEGALTRGDEQIATPFALRAAGRAQLAILRDEYPPVETEAEYRKAERIDFYDLYAEGDWLCELRGGGATFFRAKVRVTLAKLQCEDSELSGYWSFHFIVREAQ